MKKQLHRLRIQLCVDQAEFMLEDADRLYTDEWKQFVRDKYGALPSVTYFETPVIVDNVTGQIVIDDEKNR